MHRVSKDFLVLLSIGHPDRILSEYTLRLNSGDPFFTAKTYSVRIPVLPTAVEAARQSSSQEELVTGRAMKACSYGRYHSEDHHPPTAGLHAQESAGKGPGARSRSFSSMAERQAMKVPTSIRASEMVTRTLTMCMVSLSRS